VLYSGQVAKNSNDANNTNYDNQSNKH
jgi:hypothetical protein